MTRLALEKIQIDGGTQTRAVTNWETVAEYAAAMKDGAVFPPVVVYFDGAEYWLADGFHRYHATVSAQLFDGIEADIRQGTRRDAVLFSVGANATHGLQRTNEDKRRAAMALLQDSEWQKWSNGEIAKRCGVSSMFVGKLRGELSINGLEIEEPRTAIRNGTTYTVNTANIGKKTPPITYSTAQEYNQETPEIPSDDNPEVMPSLTADGSPCRFQPGAGDVGICEACGRHGDWVKLSGDKWQCLKCARRYNDDSIVIWNGDTQARDRKLARRTPAQAPTETPQFDSQKAAALAAAHSNNGNYTDTPVSGWERRALEVGNLPVKTDTAGRIPTEKTLVEAELRDPAKAPAALRRMLIACGLDVTEVELMRGQSEGIEAYLLSITNHEQARLAGVAMVIDDALGMYRHVAELMEIEMADRFDYLTAIVFVKKAEVAQ